MKRREFQKCCVCKLGVMVNNAPTFFRITVEPFMMDGRAIQRRHGMELMMGGGVGGAVLAEVMGTDEDLAAPLRPAKTLFICRDCSMQPMPIMALAEHEPIPT
ncbi:MAG: hypothetical protein AB1428_13000 [Bacteroidota bacterium]